MKESKFWSKEGSSNSANINDNKSKRDDENKINSSESKQTELDQDDYKITKKSKLSNFFDKYNDNVSGGANE
ncbi:hypothetical protein HYE36_00155 [Mycoplasmopsis bovis]|nr:hypothetical protein [Mycoplasmopsis bovis]QQH21438.1 hypothetical protein HYE36_00155 [Mycoplasmopsis bovis]QQH21799.1 hypothetical protein HYE34_00155 [Mycoplasmopsis bovis]